MAVRDHITHLAVSLRPHNLALDLILFCTSLYPFPGSLSILKTVSTMHLTQLLLFVALLALVSAEASRDTIFPNFATLPNLNISSASSDNHDNATHHERRWTGAPPNPASDEVWEAAKCKGRKFMAQMSYSDFDVGQMLPTPANTAASPWNFRA